MDRRTEVRFGANEPVVVSLLGHPPDQGHPGKIAGASKSGLRILADVPMEINSIVRIQWATGMLIGQIRHCRCVKPGSYSVGVKISEVVQPSKLETRQLEARQL